MSLARLAHVLAFGLIALTAVLLMLYPQPVPIALGWTGGNICSLVAVMGISNMSPPAQKRARAEFETKKQRLLLLMCGLFSGQIGFMLFVALTYWSRRQ